MDLPAPPSADTRQTMKYMYPEDPQISGCKSIAGWGDGGRGGGAHPGGIITGRDAGLSDWQQMKAH